MDASQITKLMQRQNTTFINRSKTIDSSTLTWQNQIQSSKYIKGIKTCSGEQNTLIPTQAACSDGNGICNFGGSGKSTSIMTGSSQRFFNGSSSATGSGVEVYSSEKILLQQAGNNSCGVPGVSPSETNSYVILPKCDCTDTNGPTQQQPDVPINNNTNPYLPQFDTYYKFKNSSAQCTGPVQDQNQKHFVMQCHSRFPNANNGARVTCKDKYGNNINCTSCLKYPDTCDGCILTPGTY